MRCQGFRGVILIIALAAAIVVPALEANAGRSEFGITVPVSTSFSFTSFSYAVEAYYRLAGSWLAWETALRTNLRFNSLYIRNTLATATALHLCFGHVTNLLPYLGSTYFTAGFGLTFGQALVVRIALNLAASVGGGSIYFFPELRFQFGLDP